MNALARPDIGQYLNAHFVAAFQKVGNFKIVNGQKQGGNVASYFCTPDGRVLDAVAGPVDGPTLLREARWVVETCNLADLDGKGTAGLKEVFRKAHADRLLQEHGLQSRLAPRTEFTTEDVAAVLDRGRGLDNAGRIHLLLATYPLAPIGKVYRPIFERVLNEAVSTTPVQLGDAARAPRSVLAPTAADVQEDRREDRSSRRGTTRRPWRCCPVGAQRAADRPARPWTRRAERWWTWGWTRPCWADPRRRQRPWRHRPGADTARPAAVAGVAVHRRFRCGSGAGGSGDGRAQGQAAKGPVARDAWAAVVDAANRMDQRITVKIRSQAGWSATDAIEAATFLTRLRDSAVVLRQPDVSGYLNGAYAAKGKTLRELVQYMASNGLRFRARVARRRAGLPGGPAALAACDARTHAAAE